MGDAPKTSRKVTVLAIDDTPGNLIALEAVLGDDYELLTADSGAQGLEILGKRRDVGIVLLDVQMPDMDGFETASRIKQMEAFSDVPIIFITAVFTEHPYVKKGYEIGGVDYFTKPFDPELLRRKLAIYATFRQKSDLLKERERQVRESEELLKAGQKLSTVLDGVRAGVLIADRDGRVCQINSEVARIFNAVEPIEQGKYGEILGWWDADGSMIKVENGPLERAIHRGETTHNQRIDIHCVDGTKKMLLGSASPLLGLDSSIVGAVIILRDLTESKKIEEDFEQRITKLISLGVELEQSA